jgi:SAM-dependent methyltransferase
MTDMLASFGRDYALHRAAEGRGYDGRDLLRLPYLHGGPLGRQWRVRARSFDAFVRHVVNPEAARLGRKLHILDLGAGNGWLSYRMALAGHRATALDIREDRVDGLGAAAPFVARMPDRIMPLTASFDAIPLGDGKVDIAIFNAALHYATDLPHTLAEAARVVRPGGILVVLDSPFYRREEDGAAMVREKRAQAAQTFGDRAETLLALPFIEFLTADRLRRASPEGMDWRRCPVRYPLWYELRPLRARLSGARAPSRFDLWVGRRR